MKFKLVNVFSLNGKAGNQLAVVYNDRDLTDQEMQTITLNFGFSETVFIKNQSLRIFSPAGEYAFAGHPTVGTAWCEGPETSSLTTLKGEIKVAVDAHSASVRFPGDVELYSFGSDRQKFVSEVNLSSHDVDLDGMICANSGPVFSIVPVKSHEALKNAKPPKNLLIKERPYLFFRESKSKAHVRMFSPLVKHGEDAATGSAACALAGFLRRSEATGDMLIYQGEEIGRPCCIKLSWNDSGIYIGGEVYQWGEGTLK